MGRLPVRRIHIKSSASLLLLLSLFSLINIPQSSATPVGTLIAGSISSANLNSIINTQLPVSGIGAAITTEFNIESFDAYSPSGFYFIATASAPTTMKKFSAGALVNQTTFDNASPYAAERIYDRDVFIVEISSNQGMRYYSFTAVIDFPEVTFGSVTFQDQEVGTSGSQTVTITNTGAGVLAIGVISTSNYFDWMVVGGSTCEYGSIQANATCSFDVTFSPFSSGPSVTTISIEIAARDPATIDFSANGFTNGGGSPTFPATAFSPIIFPDTQIGSESRQSVTLTNIGDGDLIVGRVTSDNLAFVIGLDGCSNSTITPSNYCDIMIIFTPVSANAENATIDFPTNTGFPDYVSLSANGVSPPPTYTVTYHATNSDNSAVTSGTPPVDSGSPYTEGLTVNAEFNSNLSLSGYSFLGWCTDTSNIEPINCSNGVILPGEMITSFIMSDIDLYPVWQANTALTISTPNIAVTAYKGVALTLTVTASAPGKMLFFAQGKRISNCLARPTSGSVAPYTATCSWKPSVTGYQTITAKLTPANISYSAITSSPLKVFVQRRTTLR